MDQSDVNPLNSPVRETSGSDTWRKYRYQYNWALYEMIQNHDKEKEYVIFMEYHEDVVFADSLEVINVKFSFNQVKTTAGKYTPYSICKRADGKLSVLGKLIDSCHKKNYSEQIGEIVIVSRGGFSFKTRAENNAHSKTSFLDLEDEQFAQIEESIRKELSLSSLPSNLYFLVPVLPENGFQDMVIGGISRLASKLYPSSKFNSNEIYRVLMDELGRKGEITEQFTKWHDAVENKGLTSSTVNAVIAQHTQVKDEATIQIQLIRLCDELGHDAISRRSVVRAFNRRVCNLRALALTAFELLIHPFSQAEPVVADILFLPLQELRASDVFHSLLNKVRADRLVVESDGQYIGADGFHAAFVLVAPKDALNDVRAAKQRPVSVVPLSIGGKVGVHLVDKSVGLAGHDVLRNTVIIDLRAPLRVAVRA